jgi:hypothetical protein
MRRKIKEWLGSPVLQLYEFAAILALATKQYALSFFCGVVIPVIAILIDWWKSRQKRSGK